MECGLTREKLQTEILVLQLEKAEIQEERERLIHQLERLNRKNRYMLSLSPSNKSVNFQKESSRSVTNDSD